MRHISRYLGLVTEAERALGDALVLVALRHMNEPDIREGAQLLSSWSEGHIQTLRPAIAQFGKDSTAIASAFAPRCFGGGDGAHSACSGTSTTWHCSRSMFTRAGRCSFSARRSSVMPGCNTCANNVRPIRHGSARGSTRRFGTPRRRRCSLRPIRPANFSPPSQRGRPSGVPVAGSSVLRRLLPWASSTLVSRAGAALLRPRPTNRIRQAVGSTITGVAAAIQLAGLGHRVLAFMPPSEKSLTTSRMRIR